MTIDAVHVFDAYVAVLECGRCHARDLDSIWIGHLNHSDPVLIQTALVAVGFVANLLCTLFRCGCIYIERAMCADHQPHISASAGILLCNASYHNTYSIWKILILDH